MPMSSKNESASIFTEGCSWMKWCTALLANIMIKIAMVIAVAMIQYVLVSPMAVKILSIENTTSNSAICVRMMANVCFFCVVFSSCSSSNLQCISWIALINKNSPPNSINRLLPVKL